MNFSNFMPIAAHCTFGGQVPALVALTALDARSGFKDDCRASTFVAIFKRVLKKKHRSQRVWDFSSVLL